jgi:hypothetical protein
MRHWQADFQRTDGARITPITDARLCGLVHDGEKNMSIRSRVLRNGPAGCRAVPLNFGR